jgi:hypothetical protein
MKSNRDNENGGNISPRFLLNPVVCISDFEKGEKRIFSIIPVVGDKRHFNFS